MDFAGFDMLQPGNEDTEGSRGERRESGKRGRKPGRKAEKTDMKQKLERSRQSARECRARKKLRYQYLEELVADREKAVFALREELERTCEEVTRRLLEGSDPSVVLQVEPGTGGGSGTGGV